MASRSLQSRRMSGRFNGQLEAVIFDFGNTLVSFDTAVTRQLDGRLADELERHFGHVDLDGVHAIRDRNRKAPYSGDFAENHLPTITAAMVRELYDVEPDDEVLDALLQVRFDAIVEAAVAPDYVHDFLERMATRYTLGLISNYPDGHAIRACLKKLDLE